MLEYCYAANLVSFSYLFLSPQSAALRRVGPPREPAAHLLPVCARLRCVLVWHACPPLARAAGAGAGVNPPNPDPPPLCAPAVQLCRHVWAADVEHRGHEELGAPGPGGYPTPAAAARCQCWLKVPAVCCLWLCRACLALRAHPGIALTSTCLERPPCAHSWCSTAATRSPPWSAATTGHVLYGQRACSVLHDGLERGLLLWCSLGKGSWPAAAPHLAVTAA